YTSRVCEALDSCKGQVILVGHSMGGAVITQSGEYRPDKIKKLVYLTGFLLRNGQCLLDVANQDTEALVMRNAMLDEKTNSLSFRKGAAKEIFYWDCSDDDANYAEPLLVPQALAPFQTRMVTSEEKFGRIPRVYIECLNDRAITPGAQKRMYEALPCQRVISMKTGHSPFLSAPEELAKNLLSVV
ncbi:MAG: alpha/beta fold hydrolase, partial [Nitrososphaerota archaeon]|nr:alpha/beta fold hydrolase [Nitrososphaerota archaeon]